MDLSLRWTVATLRRFYRTTPRPISREPFRLVLWEQVAYLVSDAQRRRAFAALRAQVGLTPGAILSASDAKLRAIARLGGPIAVEVRAARMRRSAELVVERWEGDLRAALRLPLSQARRALAQFPMIGEPGADKILVFATGAPLLPLDSNGLRVLERLGLVRSAADYRTSYRRAQLDLAPALPKDPDALIAAYHLLRRHGQEICRRTAPACSRCPLRERCAFASKLRRGA
jgi:endonuclease III